MPFEIFVGFTILVVTSPKWLHLQPYATTSQEAAINAFDLASWIPDNGETQ